VYFYEDFKMCCLYLGWPCVEATLIFEARQKPGFFCERTAVFLIVGDTGFADFGPGGGLAEGAVTAG
jgi:hypothetical protein